MVLANHSGAASPRPRPGKAAVQRSKVLAMLEKRIKETGAQEKVREQGPCKNEAH